VTEERSSGLDPESWESEKQGVQNSVPPPLQHPARTQTIESAAPCLLIAGCATDAPSRAPNIASRAVVVF